MTSYFADSDYSELVRLLLMTCNQSHCCWPHIECLDVLIFSSPLSVPIAELCVSSSKLHKSQCSTKSVKLCTGVQDAAGNSQGPISNEIFYQIGA